jgi:hypothetical protein
MHRSACLFRSVTLLLLSGVTAARAQSAGQFVIPEIRAAGGTDFAYWDLFAKPPAPQNYNYNYANPPALLTGEDADENPTNLFAPRVAFLQTGSPFCFVTSSGALYDFAAPTAFEVRYLSADNQAGEATNVIFQTQTGGTRFDINNIRLVFTRNSGGSEETVSVAPVFRALDDPQSGSFAERLVSAFQWNLTGQGVRDFKLIFAAPGSSMPLWQSQLDVVHATAFKQQLGWLLFTSSRPVVRHGRPGSVGKNLPSGVDDRFFLPNQTVPLSGDAAAGWTHMGWLRDGVVTDDLDYSVTFTTSDIRVTALFAPETYEAWRDAVFFHANELLGQPADNTDDAVSGHTADPDEDGVPNFSEYVFGGDPYTPDNNRTTPQVSTVKIGDLTYPAITYRQGLSQEFGDAICTVRVSQDLQNWADNETADPHVTQEVSRVLQADGTSLITVRGTSPVTAVQKLYFSVKAE